MLLCHEDCRRTPDALHYYVHPRQDAITRAPRSPQSSLGKADVRPHLEGDWHAARYRCLILSERIGRRLLVVHISVVGHSGSMPPTWGWGCCLRLYIKRRLGPIQGLSAWALFRRRHGRYAQQELSAVRSCCSEILFVCPETCFDTPVQKSVCLFPTPAALLSWTDTSLQPLRALYIRRGSCHRYLLSSDLKGATLCAKRVT